MNDKISRLFFVAVLMVMLLNAVICTANLLEDGFVFSRFVPAGSWILAILIWVSARPKMT